MSCYVYLIRCQKNLYKIGVAKNVRKRLAAIQTSNPFKLELVTCYEFDSKATAHNIEYQLHARFSRNRKNGEWFSLTPEKIDYLHAHCINHGGIGTHPTIKQQILARILREQNYQQIGLVARLRPRR